MHIAVCIKQVPDTEAHFELAEDRAAVVEEGLTWIINPHDESALEKALQLREARGGRVTVVALGPGRVQPAIRQGLAMGADDGIHLETTVMPQDSGAIAKALAAELAQRGFDLVLTGEVAIDGNGGQVPQRLAGLLGLPCVTGAERLEVVDQKADTWRVVDQGEETATLPLPAVIGINRRMGEPRYPSFRGIMQAKRKPIDTVTVEVEAGAGHIVGLRLPEGRSGGHILEHGPGVAGQIVQLLKTEAKVF